MDPRVVREHLLPEIEGELLYFGVSHTSKDIGDPTTKLSQYFQALGLCWLLHAADTHRFRENLVRSAQARFYYLRKAEAEGNRADRCLALSWSEASFDALAAGALDIARAMAQISIVHWEPSWEYEDDFCYRRLLNLFLMNPRMADEAEISALIQQFERSLQGGEATRLEVCKALLIRDEVQFEDALLRTLDEVKGECDLRRPSMAEPEPEQFCFWPRSFISVEGLALLRVAEVSGLNPTGDYPLCPQIARLPRSEESLPDLFDVLDRARGNR